MTSLYLKEYNAIQQKFDFTSDYNTRLLKLNLLPLMYIFDLYILFFIKSIQNPSDSFDIRNFVDFYHLSTRSSTSYKLKPVISSTNRQSNFYFNRLPKLCNALPALNLNLFFNTIKKYLKQLF